MSGKNKRCPKVEAVSITFGFVPETARKRQVSSINELKQVTKSCVLAMKPVEIMPLTNDTDVLQKSALIVFCNDY